MTTYLPAIFALIVGAAGWFYMFYSRAALKLASMEPPQANQRRVRLRRACGFVMILLAFVFYAGCVALDRERWSLAMLYMMAVFVCMLVILLLAWIDVRMIRDLRRRQQQRAAAASSADDVPQNQQNQDRP